MSENLTNAVDSEQNELEKKAQALLEEKDSEARTRTYSGWFGKAVTVGLCMWTVFQLYYNTIGAMSAINLRAFHCIFLLVFTFILYPAYKTEKRKRTLPNVLDMILQLWLFDIKLYAIFFQRRQSQPNRFDSCRDSADSSV